MEATMEKQRKRPEEKTALEIENEARQEKACQQQLEDITEVYLPRHGLSLDRLFALFLIFFGKCIRAGLAFNPKAMRVNWLPYSHVIESTIETIETTGGYIIDSGIRRYRMEMARDDERNTGFASASRRAARIAGLEHNKLVAKMLKRIESDNRDNSLRNSIQLLPKLLRELADPFLRWNHRRVINHWCDVMSVAMVEPADRKVSIDKWPKVAGKKYVDLREKCHDVFGSTGDDPLGVERYICNMVLAGRDEKEVKKQTGFWIDAGKAVIKRNKSTAQAWKEAESGIKASGQLDQIGILRSEDRKLGPYGIKNGDFEILIVVNDETETGGLARCNMVILTKHTARVSKGIGMRDLFWSLRGLEGDSDIGLGRWKWDERVRAMFNGTLQRRVPPSYLKPEQVAQIIGRVCYKEEDAIDDVAKFVDQLLETVVPASPRSAGEADKAQATLERLLA